MGIIFINKVLYNRDLLCDSSEAKASFVAAEPFEFNLNELSLVLKLHYFVRVYHRLAGAVFAQSLDLVWCMKPFVLSRLLIKIYHEMLKL